MFDPLADPDAARAATMGGKRWRNPATLSLVIVGRILLVVSAIMTDVSVVLPWFHLSATGYSDVVPALQWPVELDADPLTILQLFAGGEALAPAFLLAALAFLLAALGIGVSSLGLAFSRRSQTQSALAILLLVLILLYVVGMFLLVSIARVALSHPPSTTASYYQASVQYGVSVAAPGAWAWRWAHQWFSLRGGYALTKCHLE